MNLYNEMLQSKLSPSIHNFFSFISQSVPIERPVPYTIEKKVPYPIIIPVKKPQIHHHDYRHHDTHSHHHLYDHHTDFTNNKYQQVSAQRPQSSEQSSSSSSGSSTSSASSSNEQEFLPQRNQQSEHHSHQENTKLFSPYQQHSETPYQQQHQLHHNQQQYAQLRRDLLTRERMRSSSEESEADSTEFRPILSSQSAEYMSPSSNIETVVPAPPQNQQTRTPFHINVPNGPNENEPEREATSNSEQLNKFTHNIEIPVHFYRLHPLENGEGFAITK